MDFSRLRAWEAVGAVAAIVLVASLFLNWFSLTDTPERVQQDAFICGDGDLACTGFETFPIMRVLLLLAATAPLILAWIVIRGHQLSWPPGQLTAIVGLAAVFLIGYNGLVDKPGSEIEEFGVSISVGYVIALLAAVAIASAGALRMVGEGGGAQRKPPATY